MKHFIHSINMQINGYINSPDDLLLGITTYRGRDELGNEFQALAIGILLFTVEFCWYQK